MSLFNELKRRNVFRVSIAYVFLSWLVMQVADVILNNIEAPDWVFHVILLMLGIGLPFAVFFAWAFELTPEGLKREREVDRSQSITPQTGRKLDYTIIAVMFVALAYFSYDKFVREAARVETTTQTAAEQAVSEGGEDAEFDKSIAVLPFINLSSDKEQDYFSDGLSEELLNLLAKIPQLRVAARTSSFSLKGKNLQIAEIGEILKVAHVLEGSVRKSGKQVRITAQLVHAKNGYHVWSETYDRSLDNIFAIQDEIASAVVAKLKITLLGEPPKTRETDPEAYALYLQGRHLGRLSTEKGYTQSNQLYEKALVIDPEYAAAWDGLSINYTNQAGNNLRPRDEGYSLAREMDQKALAVDPDYAPAHAGLGWIAMTYDHDLEAAARHFSRALELEPTNIDAIRNSASLLQRLHRRDEAIEVYEHVLARTPADPVGYYNLAAVYLDAGRLDEAIASYSTTLKLSPGYLGAHGRIGKALLLKGETEAALAEILQEQRGPTRLVGLVLVYRRLGKQSESAAALAELIEEYEQGWSYDVAFLLADRGEIDSAFEWLDKAVEYHDPGLGSILQNALFVNLHDDPRWLPFIENLGNMTSTQLAAIDFKVPLPD